MREWLANWLRRGKAELRGGPATPRLKTYSSQSGYVYQYRFLGSRESRYQAMNATEYVFEVSSGPHSSMSVKVVVPAPSLAHSETAFGRALAGNERYAIAKMSLFHAFDERPDPSAMRADVMVRAADAAAILSALGL